MNTNVTSIHEHIRKIEDIIDIQKANGNFTSRQVAFTLPSELEGTVSANIAKSLESGLSKSKSDGLEKKIKKSRLKRHKSPLPDVISWPSDSDITVLRMKLRLHGSNLKEKVGNVIPGDGLHQPDSSSMVNLATLMRQSQSPSKHSIIEEYLLPLTSWEQGQNQGTEAKTAVIGKLPDDATAVVNHEPDGYSPVCSRQGNRKKYYVKDDEVFSDASTKSKIARFLRMYFCPCCRCLYKMENMSDVPSIYYSDRNITRKIDKKAELLQS